MAEISFRKGEDREVTISVLNGSIPVNVGPEASNLMENIKAILMVGTTIIAKYSLNTLEGYGELQFHPSVNHQVVINVTREQSKTFPVGMLKAEILADFVDADFPTSGRREKYAATIGRIVDSTTADEA